MSPSHPHVLRIGQVGLQLFAGEVLPELPSLVPPSFLADLSALDSSTSNIRMDFVGSSAPLNSSPLRFDAQRGLSVQREGDGYRLGLYKRGAKSPHTVVCVDADTTKVKVHLGSGPKGREETVWPSMARVLTVILRWVIASHLADRGGILVHAAGGVIDGRALVFSGVSTGGKSTLMRSFLDAGLGDSLLSDDRVVVRLAEGGGRERPLAEAWGTPWSSGAGVARNAHAPLAGLVFLARADACRLVPIASGEAMRQLMPTVSYPWYDEQRAGQVLDTCTRLVEAVPCYQLQFSPGKDVVRLLCGYPWDRDSRKGSGAESC